MTASPLTPVDKNAFNISPAVPQSAASPLGLPPKDMFSPKDVSSPKPSLASSPFSAFTPSAVRRNFGFSSPGRASDHDGDIDMTPDAGNDTMASTFSEAPIIYNVPQGVKREAVESPERKRSPPKPRGPETPKSHNELRSRTSSETPRTIRPRSRHGMPADGNANSPSPPSPHTPKAQIQQTPNLIMDFTQQFDAITRPAPQTGTPTYATHRRIKSSTPFRSPSKHPLPPQTPTESRFFNLLDFSPGPIVTPRSAPSITPREVEDIRAGYESQIATLQAQLSGREVEVSGLRTAVGDAQNRATELSAVLKEQTRASDAEREGWNQVKSELAELFEAEKNEKESLHELLAEKESVVENLHREFDATRTEIVMLRDKLRDADADAKKARDEVLKVREEAAAAAEKPSSNSSPTSNAEVERVARELHALYKAKHESKVTALKKSYEGRWEKRVTALQTEVATLSRKNEELQHELEERNSNAEEFTHDMSFSPMIGHNGVGAAMAAQQQQQQHQQQQQQQQKEMQEMQEAQTLLRREIDTLKASLEDERAEKAELIASVEELLELQSGGGVQPMPPATEERVRGSMRRVSGMGLKSAAAAAATTTSSSSSSSSGKSLKSSIEKMGMGYGAAREKS